jgi:hypothetical protein
MNKSKRKSTQRGTAELITLWVPSSQLPLLTQFAQQRGISRSKLLIDGAKLLMRLIDDKDGDKHEQL